MTVCIMATLRNEFQGKDEDEQNLDVCSDVCRTLKYEKAWGNSSSQMWQKNQVQEPEWQARDYAKWLGRVRYRNAVCQT